LLTESRLMSGLGGLLGLLFAQGGTRVLLAFMQLKSDPISFSVALDARVLLFTTGAALLTGILFGLAPALRSSRVDLATAMKGAAATMSGSLSRQRLNQSLVVTQVALSLTLLIGAGLFVRTLRNLKGMDMGFKRENVVQFDIDFVQRIESKQRIGLYKDLLPRLEALPGVQAASLYGFGLLSGSGYSDRVLAEGYVEGKVGAGTFVRSDLPEKYFEIPVSSSPPKRKPLRRDPGFAGRHVGRDRGRRVRAQRERGLHRRSVDDLSLARSRCGLFRASTWSGVRRAWASPPRLRFTQTCVARAKRS